MQRYLIPSALLLVVGSMGVTRVISLEGHIDRLEDSRREVPQRLREVQGEMVQAREAWQASLAKLEGDLRALESTKVQSESVLISELQEATASLEVERGRIERLQVALEDRGVEEKIQQVSERFKGLSQSVNTTRTLVESTREDLGRMAMAMQPAEAEVGHRWQRIVGPTVQLAGDSTVGSGVVLQSTPLPDGTGYETQVVTAWHVVRDILADKISPMDQSIPVTLFLADGTTRSRSAHLVAKNAVIDAALLVLDGDLPVPYGATLASREYLASRRIFHSVYAVGCPLGNDPIPTPGEISDLDHKIDGSKYWMISAPTYIGNSGGGIYDEGTNHLMGLFSKIYTHGNVRPTIVPHMGLVSPLELVYQWLEDEGIAEVIDKGNTATIRIL